jgi:hypothetical protein
LEEFHFERERFLLLIDQQENDLNFPIQKPTEQAAKDKRKRNASAAKDLRT